MKRNLIVLLTILVCGLAACKPGQKKEEDMEKETKLKIETSAGDITVKLYNETPKHRDNFIKLVEDGTYEGTLFHRVIKDFMIQAGDPESKKAPKGRCWGQATWVIPFLPNLFIRSIFTKKVLCRLHARVMR